jgi:hypothetical protein
LGRGVESRKIPSCIAGCQNSSSEITEAYYLLLTHMWKLKCGRKNVAAEAGKAVGVVIITVRWGDKFEEISWTR